MYETAIGWKNWPYKGTDVQKIKVGFNVFFYYYPKKVRMALWEYDVWEMLDDDNKLIYIQLWAESINEMHLYPYGSLAEIAEYLIKNEGYSYRDLVSVGYDSVNHINPDDDIWVWDYEGTLCSYANFDEYLRDFKELYDWDDFEHWAMNPYGKVSKEALQTVLQFKNIGVHLDYFEMLGDYFGGFPDQLTGEKRDWFIRRIKAVYQVGDVEAERILTNEEE
jgi:hypothetical protein